MSAKYVPLIRTEKHELSCEAGAGDDLRRVVLEYRKLVRALAGVIFVNIVEVSKAASTDHFIEQLFHKTAGNPAPKYELLDRMFHKFPKRATFQLDAWE